MNIGNNYFIMLCIYRSPCRDVEEIFKQLELILKFPFKPKFKLIICGDFKFFYKSQIILFSLMHYFRRTTCSRLLIFQPGLQKSPVLQLIVYFGLQTNSVALSPQANYTD
jgi:hypothetical protein